MDKIKANSKTIILILATIILGAAAIITAWKLYQMRQEAVAPTAPEEVPAQAPQLTSCQLLSFRVAAATIAPTATATAAPTTPGSTTAPTTAPTTASTAAPRPTATTRATVRPVAASSSSLPVSGTSLPTIGVALLGIVLLAAGILLAF